MSERIWKDSDMERIAYVAALKGYRLGFAKLGLPGEPEAGEDKVAEWLANFTLTQFINANR